MHQISLNGPLKTKATLTQEKAFSFPTFRLYDDILENTRGNMKRKIPQGAFTSHVDNYSTLLSLLNVFFAEWFKSVCHVARIGRRIQT